MGSVEVSTAAAGRVAPARPGLWYGARPAWQLRLERDVHREHHRHLRCEQGIGITWRDSTGWLAYHHDGLDVPGFNAPVPVTVAFFESPPYDTYGISPANYPRVWADCGAVSPHRMPDDALCLYYPRSPVELRWTAPDGLLPLLNLVRDHLFFEHYWRITGGHPRGRWLGTEAPHGFATRRAS